MLGHVLQREGYDVIDAPDGKAGIRAFREQGADLIISDIIMPEKEGLETVMELRRDFPEVKIIAISGGGHVNPDEYLHMAAKLGAQLTLTKPFERDELLAAVEELLAQHCT
jgi:DNA-binding response OmpR family regulator